MTLHRVPGRLALSVALVFALASGAAAALPSADGAGAAASLPTLNPARVAVGPLDASPTTVGGSIALKSLAAPPSLGEAGSGGDMLQGGGSAPTFRYYALDALGSVRVVFDSGGTSSADLITSHSARDSDQHYRVAAPAAVHRPGEGRRGWRRLLRSAHVRPTARPHA